MPCDQSQAARQAEARRRQVERKKCQLQSSRATLLRIGTPPPVAGRKHEPVQTELFLEEVTTGTFLSASLSTSCFQ